MTRLRFYLLAAVFCSLTVLGQGDISVLTVTNSDPTPSHTEPSTVNVKSDSTTVVTTPEDPATKHKTTTTEKTTTSSTTTTTTTTTTTPPPTTTPPTTTSTTTTPAPTPKPTPAPTPAPGPAPAPKQGKWVYKDSKNVTCIVVQFAAQLNVTYTKAANSSLQYFVVNVPPTAAVVDGNCNGTEQWLDLTWAVKNETVNATYNNMVLYFHQNATTKMYSLKYLNISLAPEMFPNSSNTKAPVEFWHGVEWTTPLATSYRCATPTQLNMTSDMAAATLTLSQLQEEAFRTSKDEAFSAARECSGTDVPDAVPIAVGCALGALVVVVLVAYLVARRRSAAQGYLSM